MYLELCQILWCISISYGLRNIFSVWAYSLNQLGHRLQDSFPDANSGVIDGGLSRGGCFLFECTNFSKSSSDSELEEEADPLSSSESLSSASSELSSLTK